MAELTIDLTYGIALFEAAVDTGKKDIIMEEATEVLGILKHEPGLHDFINYPAISAIEKKKALKGIFDGKICDELLNFMYILIDKGRTMHFEKMIKVYKKLLDEAEGLSYGTVYSVIPLGEDRMAELERQTSELLKENVRLNNEIDPRLIGGIKVLIEGKMLDASIRKRFDDLEGQINLT